MITLYTSMIVAEEIFTCNSGGRDNMEKRERETLIIIIMYIYHALINA